MSLPRDLARWSLAERAIRFALVLLVAVLGYYSVTFSVAQVIVTTDPELAYRLAPYDGRVTAALAASLSGPEATPSKRARSEALAIRALRQDPTAVAAVATLGVNADLRGDAAAARTYFTYAQTLSRRDLRTNLWMIEDAVRRGDILDALRQYDITLRVFPNMSEVLYPVLTAASTDQAIRPQLIRTLAGKPTWGENFVIYVATRTPEPRATAALFQGLKRAGVTVPQVSQARVIDALLAANQVEPAWAYYASVREGASRQKSRDPTFSANLSAASRLDWIAINDEKVATTVQGGLADFTAPASVGGALLRQVQLLPPGTYHLTGHSIGIEQEATSRPYWVLACKDGRELGRVEMPNSSVADGRFSGVFTVPVGCPVQALTLIARPSDAVAGLSGQIDWVDLAPAGR